MKILITGGAGFIGSHLAKRLLEQGHQLSIIDFLHPYYSPERKKMQLNALTRGRTYSFYEVDLLDNQRSEAVFRKEKPDVVIHLAALPGVTPSLKEPLQYVDYDIKATINVLKLAGEHNVSQVIFASSSSVYGEKQGFPLKETDASGDVVSPYAAAKYGAESFCKAYQSLYGFNLTILRFFTVYGPWGRPDMAIPIFIDRLMNKQPITVYGTGTSRDFTYIDDVVSGIEQAIVHPCQSEVFNIGSGSPVSMKTVIDTLRIHFPEAEVKFEPFRTGDVTSTWAEIKKSKQLLGFNPETSFTDGIERTIEWYKGYEKHKALDG